MCSCCKWYLETKAVPNIQFQAFELSLHSEKDFEVCKLCYNNSMSMGFSK